MTQLFSGEGLGLSRSCLNQLERYVPKSTALLGQGKEATYVNAANGNFVLRQEDGFLKSTGLSLDLFETYNSLGERSGEAWCFSTQTRLILDSSQEVVRVDEEGHRSRFIFDLHQGCYQAEEGSTTSLCFKDSFWYYKERDQSKTYQYNKEGQLISLNDQEGHFIQFSYLDGKLLRVEDQSNRQYAQWIFEQGQVSDLWVKSEDQVIQHIHYDYDAAHRLQRLTRDLGKNQQYWTTYDYIADSNLIHEIRQFDGRSLLIDYDDQGRVKQLKEEGGRVTQYTYFIGKTVVTNGLKEAWVFHYDEQARLTRIEGPEHFKLCYDYDDHHLIAVTRGHLHWRFEYNDSGDCIRIEEPTGHVILRRYDHEHRLFAECRDEVFHDSYQTHCPKTSWFIYDEQGHLRFVVNEKGSVTEHRYNREGLRSNTRYYLDSGLTSVPYDFKSDLTWNTLMIFVQNQSAQAITRIDFHYDWRGFLSEEIHYAEVDAQGEGVLKGALITYTRFDATGRLVEKSVLKEAGLAQTYYFYDSLNRLTQIVDSLGQAQYFDYDDSKQTMLQTDANGLQTLRVYDHSGLLLSSHAFEKSYDFGTVYYQYDEVGRLRAETAVDGKITYYFYDHQGRLHAQVRPDGLMTEYQYNEDDCLIQTTDYQELLNTSSWLYFIPEFSSVKPQNRPQDRISQTIYNDHNQPFYHIDASGAVICYEYNTQNQVVKKTAYATRIDPDSIRYIQDADHFFLPTSREDRVFYYFYDEEGFLQAEVNGEGQASSYQYDHRGNLVETCHYFNRILNPDAGRWIAPEPVVHHDRISYALYNKLGLKVADIDAERYVTTYEYEESGLLKVKRSFAKSISFSVMMTTETTIHELGLQEDAQDHLISYQYNQLNQLVEERSYTGLITSYVYDAQGLVLKKTLYDAVTHEKRELCSRYDAMGRLVQRLDAQGASLLEAAKWLNEEEQEIIWQQHSFRYEYDHAGRMLSQTNALHHTTRFFYDDAGRMRFRVNAEGEITGYHYNTFNQIERSCRYANRLKESNRRLTTMQLEARVVHLHDANQDEETLYDYNTLGQVVSVRLNFSEQKTSYNAFGEIAATSRRIDAQHNANTFYHYDHRGLMTSQIDEGAEGHRETKTQYDALGQVQTRFNANEQLLQTYSYDLRGHLVLILDRTDPSSLRTQSLKYDAFNRRVSETLMGSNLECVSYLYDDIHQTLTVHHQGDLQQTTIVCFNALGDKVTYTDANGQKTEYQYSQNGQLLLVLGAEQSLKRYRYDEGGNLVWQQEDDLGVVQWSYDAEGRVLTKTQDADGLNYITTYRYDGLGRQLEVTDANGCCTQFYYDSAGRLVQTCVDPHDLCLTTLFKYDDRGLLLRQELINPQGQNKVIAYVWDEWGRRLAIIVDPEGLNLITRYAYDKNNNRVLEVDANQNTRHFIYDVNNQCRYQIDARGFVLEHRYDSQGNEIQTIRYAHQISELTDYNEVSLEKILLTDEEKDQYQFRFFDENNRIKLSFDALGYATRYRYDGNGNLIHSVRFSQPSSFRDLKAGRLILPTEEAARHQYFIYNGLNQVRYQIDSAGFVTESVYDKSGQRVATTRYAQAYQVHARELPNLETLRSTLTKNEFQDQTTRFSYDKAGRLNAQLSAEGIATGYVYDGVGHCVSVRCYAMACDPGVRTPVHWQESLIKSDEDRITDSVYDAAGREVYRLNSKGRVVERCYDAVGNVIAEITHIKQIPHDVNNQQSLRLFFNEQCIADRTTYYEYDAASRLLVKNNAEKQEVRYTYDAMNNVLSQQNAKGAVWTYFYNETNQLIETHSPSTMITTPQEGEWLTQTRTIRVQNDYDGFGNLLSVVRDVGGQNQTLCYEYDKLNRRIKTIYPDVAIQIIGNAVSSLRQEKRQTLTEEQHYNAFGDIIMSSNRAGDCQHFIYNDLGQLIYSVDAEGSLTRCYYDSWGNLSHKTRDANRMGLNSNVYYEEKVLENVRCMSQYDRHEEYRYDRDNRLIQVSKDVIRAYNPVTQRYDELRPITQYAYNAFGEVIVCSVRCTDTEWSQTETIYNTEGKKVAVLDAEGYLSTYSYSSFAELTEEIQYANRITTKDWKKTLPQRSAQDRQIVLAYNECGLLVSKTLKNASYQQRVGTNRFKTVTADLITTFGYDALGQRTSTTDAKGYVTYCYYDTLGQLIAKVSPETQTGKSVTTYAYDALGKLVHTTRFAHNVQFADEAHYILPSMSEADVHTYELYDHDGQRLMEVDGEHHVIQYSYSANGQVARCWQIQHTLEGKSLLIDKRYLYDKEGHVEQIALWKADDQWMTQDFRYNAFGEIIAQGIDGELNTKMDYDLLGRVWRSNASGYYQIYVYDLRDKVTQVVMSTNAFREEYGENGVDLSVLVFEKAIRFNEDQWCYDVQRHDKIYDKLGYLTRQIKRSPHGVSSDEISQSQVVDRWGNRLQSISALGHETLYDYNVMNQVIQQTLPKVSVYDEQGVEHLLRPIQYYAYDELGRAIGMMDAQGHCVSKEVDAEGHIIDETDARGASRKSQYDLLGRRTQLRNELGALTEYQYDKNNQLLAITNCNGMTQCYSYDENGHLIAQTIDDHEQVRLEYDRLGHTIYRHELSGQEFHTIYDDAGHKLYETDAQGRTQSWIYDKESGRLQAHTDLGNHTTFYTYNQNGLLRTEKSTAGKDLIYHYRHDGQLLQYVDQARLEVVDYDYDSEDNVLSKISSRAGGERDGWLREMDHYAYDVLGRLTQVRRRHPDDIDIRFPPKDRALLSIDYEYDAVGNIRHTEVNANYTGYASVHSNDYYLYDENNRMVINKGLLVDGSIRINFNQGSQLNYDAAGNLTEANRYENGYDQHYVYHYNLANQLVWIEKNGMKLKSMAYDTTGHITEEKLFDHEAHATAVNRMTYDHGLLIYQTTWSIEREQSFETQKRSFSYDAVGNLVSEESLKHQGSSLIHTHHRYRYVSWDSDQQSTDEAAFQIDNLPQTFGRSTRRYDVNGQLQEVIDEQADNQGRSHTSFYWISSKEGIRAKRDQCGQTSYLSLAGKMLGDLQLTQEGKQYLTVYGGFTPMGSPQTRESNGTEETLPNTPQELVDSYIVQAGDTLESIAHTVYGESSLWYLIADANGIASLQASILQAGQRLTIPLVAQNQHQTAASHRVMDSNVLLGNLSATTPLPIISSMSSQKPHYPFLVQVMVAVVSTLATVLSAGIMASLAGVSNVARFGTVFKLGLGALTGSIMPSMAATLGVGAAAGLIGDLAAQGLSNLMGHSHGIDWHNLLFAGLATAASAGLSRALNSSSAYKKLMDSLEHHSPEGLSLPSAASLIEQDALGQGLQLAFKKQPHFDWVELGSKAIVRGVFGSVNAQKIGQPLAKILGEGSRGFVQSELGALAEKGGASLVSGSCFNAIQVLTDNLGNALSTGLIGSQSREIDQDEAKQAAAPVSQGIHKQVSHHRLLDLLNEQVSDIWHHYGDELLIYGPKVLGVWGGTSSDEVAPSDLNLSMRLQGVLEAVEGGSELGFASVMTVVSDGLLAAAGYTVGLHGADHVTSGIRQLWTGKQNRTQMQVGLEKLGVSDLKIEWIDTSLSMTSLTSSLQTTAVALTKFTEPLYYQASFIISHTQNWWVGLKMVNYGSIVGNGVLGGVSGAYGAVAAGSGTFDTVFQTGIGVLMGGFVENKRMTPLKTAIISAEANVVSQIGSTIYDSSNNNFSIISLIGSTYAGGIVGHLTRHAGPVSGMIIGSMPDAAINSIAINLGERWGW